MILFQLYILVDILTILVLENEKQVVGALVLSAIAYEKRIIQVSLLLLSCLVCT